MTSEELDQYRPVDADARQQRRDDYAAMGYARWEIDDLDTMHDLLARLRACAVARVEACEQMTLPQNGLEMQRQARALRATADLVVDLHSPAPRRTRKAPVRVAPPSMPRPASPDPDIPPPPKPRPAKPEPSPFMKGMDEIERELRQIVTAQKVLIDEMPDDMDFPPELTEALTAAEKIGFDPDATSEDRVVSMARVIREATVAKAAHRLKKMDPDNAADIDARLKAARRSSTAIGRAMDTPAPAARNGTKPPP